MMAKSRLDKTCESANSAVIHLKVADYLKIVGHLRKNRRTSKLSKMRLTECPTHLYLLLMLNAQSIILTAMLTVSPTINILVL